MPSTTPTNAPRVRRSGLLPWSLRLGRIAGIPIRLHLTFLLLLAWIAMSFALRGLGPAATLRGLVLVLAVFAIIVIHELGHALAARRFGIATREILLLPIGGVSSLERIPERPRQELVVAVVGPAINFVLAGLLWLWLAITGAPPSLAGGFAAQLMWINIVLGAFNLIPAFPMDGGRVLRALLAMRLGRARATAVAANLGKGFAIVLGLFGLYANPWLVLIAIVIWLGAHHEGTLVRLRAALVHVPVREAMNRQVDVVRPDEPLGEAARLLVATGQEQLPIVADGSPVGVLTRGDVAAGIRREGVDAPIQRAAYHDVITVEPSAPLEGVFDQLAHTPDTIAVVVDHGVTIGVVTTEQLATFVALHANHPTAPR